jgi:Ser/Thr protein kinase RdoA (MazF antagonist)
MLGANWKGIKPISEGGPFHARGESGTPDAASPDPGRPGSSTPDQSTPDTAFERASERGLDGDPDAYELEQELDPRVAEQRLLDSLDPAHRQALAASVAAARPVADAVLADLHDVTQRMEGFTDADRPRTVDEEYRVKELPSLARKFVDAHALDGTSPADFLAEVNDRVRFSVLTPQHRYGEVVTMVLGSLTARGYTVDDVKNFWRPGNRHNGVNVTLRSPGGFTLEVQFPTDASRTVGKQTHRLYEIIRLETATPEARVEAYLEILRLNRVNGIADRMPAGLDRLPGAIDTSFEKWASRKAAVWAEYQRRLAEQGVTFAEVVAARGLTPADFPRGERLGLSDGDVRLSRGVQAEGARADRQPDSGVGGVGDPAARGAVERPEGEVELRAGDRGPDDLRGRGDGEDGSGRPGDGGDGGPGRPGAGAADRGGAAPDLHGGREPGNTVAGGQPDGPLPELADPPTADPVTQLTPEQVRVLTTLLGNAHQVADRVMGDLNDIGARLSRALESQGHPPGEVRLLGEEYRVKEFDSLARKFRDEGVAVGQTVERFAATVNDAVRFSLQLPGGAAYTPALDAVLADLSGRGYTDIAVENYWAPGNMYNGLCVYLRAPGGQLMELQFPTELSWRASMDTHGFYEVRRLPTESPVARVHAGLATLRYLDSTGLSGQTPPGLAERWPPYDTSLAWWTRENPDVWRAYGEWLAADGRTLDDVAAQFGLRGSDLPELPAADQVRAEDAGVLRDPRVEGAHRPTEGDLRAGSGPWRSPDLGSHPGQVAVQPGAGQPSDLRPDAPGAHRVGGPADGGAVGAGDHRNGAPAGRDGHIPDPRVDADGPAPDHLTEHFDGDTGGLREGPVRPAGGGVHLRVSGDGPAAGDREGLAAGETPGRERGPQVLGGSQQGGTPIPQRGDVAGAGGVRGVTGPTHTASPIAGTDFVPDGRAAHVADLSLNELHWAAARVDGTYFRGEGVLWVGTEGNLIRVDTADGRTTYFRPVVGQGLPDVAQTTVRAGTPQDPHITVVNHRVAPEQLTRTWVHEITETIHMRAALDQHRPQGVVRRLVDAILHAFGRETPAPHADPTHGDGHVRARLNERELLLRQFQNSRTPLDQLAIRQELMGVDRDLARLGYPSHLLPFPSAGPRTAPHAGPPTAPHAGPRTAPPVPRVPVPPLPPTHTPRVPTPRTPTMDGRGIAEHVPRHAAPAPHHASPAPHHPPPTPPAPPPPPPPLTLTGPNPANYGHLNENGVWEFDSDAAGEAFGENLLGQDFHRLPPDQQVAIREYTRHSWPYNTIARVRNAATVLKQWWDSAGTADAVRGLFGGHVPTLSDVYARAQRGPAPGTFERWLVDRVLSEPPARQAAVLNRIATDDGVRGMLIRTFGGRFPTEADIRARMALIDEAMRATPLRYGVQTNRGLQEINFMRDPAGYPMNLRQDASGRWLNEYGQPLTVEDLQRRLEGSTQQANGYMSTSLGASAAFSGESYPFRLVLDVPRGNPAIWMGGNSVYPDQRELILPQDAEYTISGVRRGPDGVFELIATVRRPDGSPTAGPGVPSGGPSAAGPGVPSGRPPADGPGVPAGRPPADGPPPTTGRENLAELVAATRTPNGLVDPGALSRFVDTAPRLEIGEGGLAAALRDFAASALGRQDVGVQPLDGGPGRGESGAPVYFVHDGQGNLTAVLKIFPRVEEMVRELSALDRLGSPEFTRFRIPTSPGVAVVDLPGGTAGAAVFSVAPGRSVYDMINDVDQTAPADRPAALAEVRQAVWESGAALAELHSQPAGSGGPVDRGFLEFNHGLARRELAAVLAYRQKLLDNDLDPDQLAMRVDETISAALAAPGGAALMHGDAHPGNIFWDPTARVTFIDISHGHFGMDAAGVPIGSPARDVANMVERLAHFSVEAGFEWHETQDLQSAFLDAYQRSGGPPIPEAALRGFAVRFALRDVLDTLTKLSNVDPESADTALLDEQLEKEVELLRRVLRWRS